MNDKTIKKLSNIFNKLSKYKNMTFISNINHKINITNHKSNNLNLKYNN